MEFTTRPAAAAAAALIAGGLIAASPAIIPLADGQLRDVTLTAGDGLAGLESSEVGTFADLQQGLQEMNSGLVGIQEKLIEGLAGIFGDGQAATAKLGLEHLFEGGNMLLGTGEGSLLAVLGANYDPSSLNTSLLVTEDQSSLAAQFGGLEGFFGHNLLLLAGLVHLTSGNEGLPSVTGLLDAMNGFNQGILTAEQTFNSHLLDSELAIEQAIFGEDSALNGIFNRGINSFNMLFDLQERSVNSLLGLTGYNPQELTDSLLTGSDAQAFNSGELGGLNGLFNQPLALIADVFGLAQDGKLDGLFDDFNPDALGDGLKDFLTTALLGPFLSADDGGDLVSAFAGIDNVFDSLGTVFGDL